MRMQPRSLDEGRETTAAGASLVAVAVLMVLCVATGGSSQESGTGLFVAQLLSLPLIGWAGYQLLLRRRQGALQWTWIALALVVVAIPLLQLLPLPADLGSEGRSALAADLAAFGVQAPTRWSLLPGATRDAALVLLPAMAVFALTLALPAEAQRRLAQLVVALAVASVLLGIAQLGAPQESPLNPYPQWRPAMNGFFANPNHQATLLVVAATLASARLVVALGAWPTGRPHRVATALVSAFVLLLALVALPLTGSRAGVIIFILACAAVVALHLPAWRGARSGRLLLAGSTAAICLGLLAALRWMRVDAIDELRAPLRDVTAGIADRFAPAGSGMGSYVPVFEQEAPTRLLMGSYVNHAHNEYLQWWLEAGVPALLAMGLAVIALLATVRGLWRLPPRERSLGLTALLALLAILAHSIVDYPLRTPAMLAVAAALAGIAAAQATRGRPSRHLPS